VKKVVQNLRNIFNKVFTPVPPEYAAQFDLILLKTSVFRIKILAVLNLCVMMFFRILSFTPNTTYPLMNGPLKMFNAADIFFIAAAVLFLALNVYYAKKKNCLMLWVLCYVLMLSIVCDFLTDMIDSDSEMEKLFYFAGLIFISLFVPDFRRRVFVLPVALMYAMAVFLFHRYSSEWFSDFQVALSVTFFAVVFIKMSNYNSKVKIFVDNIKITELNENLRALAITDELTKLNNRRSFLNYYEIIWKQGSRMQFPVNVIMIDIDYFKKYNDSLGHLEGDRALIAVAQCLKDNVKRETDFVARIGGEEFVCLLPYIDRDDAEDFAQKLVQSVENLKIPHPKCAHSEYITISAGLASVIPNERYSREQLLDESDKALYAAKQSGRNRVAAS
jgi:diguanylate cyclase (GGDEF)-like protein